MVSDNAGHYETYHRHHILYLTTHIQYLRQSPSYLNYVVVSIKKNNRSPANQSVTLRMAA